jgi:hypothetical protein
VQRGHARSGCWLPVVSYSSGGTTRLPVGRHGGPQHGKTTTNSHHRNGHQGAQEARWQVQGHPTGLRPAEGQEWPGSGIQGDHGQAESLRRHRPPVNADQEAKDRAAGRDDLTLAAATSVDQAKMKSSGTGRAATKPATPARPAKPTRPTKGQATGNGVSFSGRPTTKAETVAARVKKAGLRIRADADVDAIAARLRATPAAVSAWLATRNGAPTKPPAKATTKQPAKAKPTQRAMSQTLVQVIAQMAVFLEFADESVLNLDAAVKQQEDMAFRLQQLSPADRRDFTRLLFEVADKWPSADGRHYLRALPGAIGLT